MKICIQAGHKGTTTGATGAYIAGVLDSDGWFSIKVGKGKKSPKFEIRIGVSNTNKKLPLFFKRTCGGTITEKKKKDGWKTEYCWELGNLKAYELIKNVEEYLIIKKDRADLCIKLQESLNKTNADCRGLTVETINYRISLKEKITKLNERGCL